MTKKLKSGYLFILSGVLFLIGGVLDDQISFYGVALMFIILGLVTLSKKKDDTESK
ncbi:hypothetical protein [Colwellia piezophila]|uniref:hypothetical protein n=1 Tax=Colwellia piezophila TaxID=211668 RepID=UPI00036420EB|nr:hypothetical protein [Colwellia piezophila]